MNSATANQDEVKRAATQDEVGQGSSMDHPGDAETRSQQATDLQLNSAMTADQLKQAIHQHVQHDLDRVNKILRSSLRSSSPLVAEMVDHVSRYQGKQLRPILLMLTHRMAVTADGATDQAKLESRQPSSDQAACMLAASVEMIHLATLVHDDVIDEAETRRHVATVHRRWNTEASVLLGDFLFSRAFHLSATAGDAAACALIGKATDRTCEGELNQMAARLEQSRSELDYFRIIRGKTGQLFGLGCRLGAKSANASAKQQAAASRFGIRLGLAFQIADDILDLTESSDKTGKDAANDIQNGRRTLPILRALRFASADEEKTLNHLLGHSADDAFDQIKRLPCVTKGIESATQTAQRLVSRAIGDLQQFRDCSERQLLASIAKFAVQRNS
ncbi:MAG: polyprenyl synthetase family protein [Fuerstiella sp.]